MSVTEMIISLLSMLLSIVVIVVFVRKAGVFQQRERRIRVEQLVAKPCHLSTSHWATQARYVIRIATLAILAVPALCSAEDPEFLYYVGPTPAGTEIRLEYVSGPAPWSEGLVVYGSSVHAKLRYCWESTQVSEAANRVTSIKCSAIEGGEPIAVYRWGHLSNDHQALAREFVSRRRHEDAEQVPEVTDQELNISQAYMCVLGCGLDVPVFLFVTSDDEC